jgi:hypothetical protein
MLGSTNMRHKVKPTLVAQIACAHVRYFISHVRGEARVDFVRQIVIRIAHAHSRQLKARPQATLV